MRTLLLPLLGLSFSMQAAVAQYKHVPLSLSDATKMNIYVERTVEIGSKNVSKVVVMGPAKYEGSPLTSVFLSVWDADDMLLNSRTKFSIYEDFEGNKEARIVLDFDNESNIRIQASFCFQAKHGYNCYDLESVKALADLGHSANEL